MSDLITFSAKEKKRAFFLKKMMFPLLCGVFFVLFTLRNLMGITLDTNIFTFLTLACIFLPNGQALCYLVFILSFRNAIFFGRIILVFTIILIIKNILTLKFNKSIIWGFLLLLQELILTALYDGTLVEFMRFAQVIMLLCFIFCTEGIYKPADAIPIIKYFIIGVAAFSLLVLVGTLQRVSMAQILNGSYRLGYFFEIGAYDETGHLNPNTLAYFSLMAMALLLALRWGKRVSWVLFFGSMAFLTFIGFLSLSRAFFLIYGFMWLMVLIYVMTRAKGFKALVFLSMIPIIFGVVAVIVIDTPFYQLIANTIKRFEGDITTGRIDIMLNYLEVWVRNTWTVLFGSGMRTFYQYYGFTANTHNAIQEILVGWGIAGLIISFGLLYQFFKKCHTKPLKFYTWLPLLLLFIYRQSGQFFTAYNDLILLIPIFYALSLTLKKEKEEKI